MKAKLNKREKYAVSAGAAFLCLFVLIKFVVFPMMDKQDRLQRMIDVKTKTIADMQALKSEYDEIVAYVNASKSRIDRRPKGFTLFSFLEEVAGETGLKNKIKYMKPSSTSQKGGSLKLSMVEMKVEAINLKQLTDFLYRVETSANTVFIKRIAISKADKPQGTVDVVLQVETYEI